MPTSPFPLALVTGANRGLGLEVCRQLLAQNYQVVLTSRNAAHGLQAAAQLRAEQPGLLVTHPLDVTDPVSVEALRAWVAQEFGALDVLVNNGAVLNDDGENVLNVTPDRFAQTFATNVWGVLQLTQALLPLLRRRRHARIVNVSSEMGQWDDLDGGTPAYSLSKTTLNGLTKMLANQLKGSGILVNAVCPGWVRTDMGGPHATRSVAEGAAGIVWAATLPSDGPTGGFFRDGLPLRW